MAARIARVPRPTNEPVRPYRRGDADRDAVVAALAQQTSEVLDIPCMIGGKEVRTGNTVDVYMPSDHSQRLARVHLAGPEEIAAAVDAATHARAAWGALPWEERAAVFLNAAALLAGPRRAEINAATMLAQAKTIHQAEVDAVCELVDFWRFNVLYAEQIAADQPPMSGPTEWNQVDYRPLDGFVFAITPFNFTSIALNLPTAPALMGNTVVFKPTLQSLPPVWRLMQILREAGLPDGVINLLNGPGSVIGREVLPRPELAGIHFTGSTSTFKHLWRTVAEHLDTYHQYPRLVGETGGKDFIVAHPSADPAALAVAIVRGAFEYQGQKCSAASRIYVPQSLWSDVRGQVLAAMVDLKQGDVRDLSTFVSAVIDEAAYNKHVAYQTLAKETATVLAGGGASRDVGWFVEPTLVQVDDPHHRLMTEEIFGPIATVYVYDDSADDAWDDVLTLVDTTSPYALTGALFARDRLVIAHAAARLRFSAGNFYVNDKPTGAVVGAQPFGGSRASGTNDKAGSPQNLMRWVSPRAIKQTFAPATDWRYDFLD